MEVSMDMGFDDLVGVARGALDKASRNFGADHLESDRYPAFALVCLSEAARRHVALKMDNPGAMFLTYVDYWKVMQAGESPPPPPPPFRVIRGGKS